MSVEVSHQLRQRLRAELLAGFVAVRSGEHRVLEVDQHVDVGQRCAKHLQERRTRERCREFTDEIG